MFFGIAIAMLIFRKDLLPDAFFTGILVLGIMMLFYLPLVLLVPNVFENWWEIQNLSGRFILGIPLEEILWCFSWGFVAGPAYKFVHGMRFRN